jgi:hypothetical protein
MVERWESLYRNTLGEMPKMTKEELGKVVLPICNLCCGTPRETRLVFNPASNSQKKVILYDILKLPKKMKRNTKGKSVVSVDEKAIRSLLGGLG